MRLVCLLILILVARPTWASSFSWELQLDHATEDGFLVESDTNSLSGTYYPSKIDTTDGPLSEAGFLSQACSLSLTINNSQVTSINLESFLNLPVLNPQITESQIPFFGNNGLTAIIPAGETYSPVIDIGTSISDGTQFSGLARYVNQTGWIGKLDYAFAKHDDRFNLFPSEFLTVDGDYSKLGIGIGRYFSDTFSVELDYVSSKNELESVFSSFPFFFISGTTPEPVLRTNHSETTTKRYSLQSKLLFGQGSFSHTIQLAIGYEVNESEIESEILDPNPSGLSAIPLTRSTDQSYRSTSNVAYVFYPRRDLGFGLNYQQKNFEHGNLNTTGFFGEYFINPYIAVNAKYRTTDVTSIASEIKFYSIGIAGRF